jgi:HK97 gp10 family phage protein
MFADPAEVYYASARKRCLDIAQEIVDEIQHGPETPVETGKMKAGYRAIYDDDGALIINPVDYWPYQEFGTEDTPAQPHVRPAIEKVRARHT